MKPEIWQKVAKFKGAEYFRKALYVRGVVLEHFATAKVDRHNFRQKWVAFLDPLQGHDKGRHVWLHRNSIINIVTSGVTYHQIKLI